MPLNKDDVISVDYSKIRDCDKRKWHIDDDCNGADNVLRLILGWIRVVCAGKNAVLKDIPTLKDPGSVSPLIEIEVLIEGGKKSTKVLVCKRDLYVIAFKTPNCWYQIEANHCKYKIIGCNDQGGCAELRWYKGNYTYNAWENIGPKFLFKAVHTITTLGLDVKVYIQQLQVFFVHLSEAARFLLLELLVCKSLAPSRAMEFVHKTYEDEANLDLCTPRIDILSLLKADGPIDALHAYETTKDMKNYLGLLVHNWGGLSNAWCAYALSNNKEMLKMESNLEGLLMSTVKSVRTSLCLLKHPDMKKVMKALKEKLPNNEYKAIEKKVAVLQSLHEI